MLQRRFILFIMVFCILWLAGCEQAAPEILPTVTAVPTGTPIVIEKLVKETVVVTATPSSVPTLTPTPTLIDLEHQPTSTPRPTLTPTPTIPPRVSGDVAYLSDVDYRLRSPDPQLLADLFYDKAHYSLLQLIDMDLQRYYPAGSPEIAVMIQDPTIAFRHEISSASFMSVLQQGIVTQLNEAGIDLIQNKKLEMPEYDVYGRQVDLNGDGSPEWLLEVSSEFQTYGFHTLIPVLVDENNQYRWLKNEFATYDYGDPPYPLITNYDLTGDGINEIIQVTDVGNGRYAHWETRIYTWDGDGIVQLERLNNISVFYGDPRIDVRDSNQDGIIDIYVPVMGHDKGLTCQWSETVIYTWPNGEAQHEYINHDPPDSPECNLWRTVHYPPITGRERIELMIHTLSLPDMQMPSPFKALVLIHLGMAYVEVNDFEMATAVLDQLLDIPDYSDFVKAVQEIYRQDGERPFRFCRQLTQDVDPLVQTDFGRYYLTNESMNGYSSGGAYDNDALYKPALCDYDRILREWLQNYPLNADTQPKELLAEIGIEYQYAQLVNLDEDATLEWLGILEFSEPRTVMFDEVDGMWRFNWINGINAQTLVDSEFLAIDVTGDGLNDGIAIVTNRVECNGETSPRPSVTMLYTEDVTGNLVPAYDVCDSSISYAPESISPDYFKRVQSYPVWISLTDFPATDLPLAYYVSELQTAVLTQSDPAITTKITDLLAYLPTDDPEAQPYREHLTYLLGYHYELSGAEEQAVATYLSLIQQAPSSPWSWLAWARLEPVE